MKIGLVVTLVICAIGMIAGCAKSDAATNHNRVASGIFAASYGGLVVICTILTISVMVSY